MKKIELVTFLLVILFSMIGCSDGADLKDENLTQEEKSNVQLENEDVSKESKEIADSYKQIYIEAKKDKTLENLETKKKIISCLGDEGYSVIDMDNQINMVNPEQVEEFCKKVDEKQTATLMIIQIMNNGGFVHLDFNTNDGQVVVSTTAITWKSLVPELGNVETFSAYTWEYTKKGYLFFEKYLPDGYDGQSGHTGIRVKPLDEKCREWNQKYILPIGYELNNMFLVDWNENEYGDLCFFDLYDKLYYMKYKEDYIVNTGINGIAQDQFESVIMPYFKLDSQMLQQLTDFDNDSKFYKWRQRGMYDFSSAPYMPYPEVTGYKEREDGMVELIIDAVWPEENMDRAFTHEVLLQFFDDGTYHYVSNHVVSSKDNYIPTYVKRLTKKELDVSNVEKCSRR